MGSGNFEFASPNKRMQSDVAYGHAADAERYVPLRGENVKKIIPYLWLVTFIAFTAIPAYANAAELVHVRLEDRLDRPKDGYCFDILGTGSNLRLGVPLFAHNCKDGATPDSAVNYTSKGQLVFPSAGVCVTAFGVNNTVLPGAAVLLRPCDYQIAFFNTSSLQKFDHLKDGQLQLRGHNLCLAVGKESSRTYSPFDRWRVLSLESCTKTALTYSAWEMVPL